MDLSKKTQESFRNRPPKYAEAEPRLGAWVWYMPTRKINVTDELLHEKSQAVFNTYNELCDKTAKVDSKLNIQGLVLRVRRVHITVS